MASIMFRLCCTFLFYDCKNHMTFFLFGCIEVQLNWSKTSCPLTVKHFTSVLLYRISAYILQCQPSYRVTESLIWFRGNLLQQA